MTENSFETDDEVERKVFKITFSKTEWEIFRPVQRKYKQHEKHKAGIRMYTVLNPNQWGNIIAEHFMLQNKTLKCTLNFKRGYINKTDQVIEVKGYCNECKSEFIGTIHLDTVPTECERSVCPCTSYLENCWFRK